MTRAPDKLRGKGVVLPRRAGKPRARGVVHRPGMAPTAEHPTSSGSLGLKACKPPACRDWAVEAFLAPRSAQASNRRQDPRSMRSWSKSRSH